MENVSVLERWIEYLRAFFWLPSDQCREEEVYVVGVRGYRIRVVKFQRLYYGRWGRMKWKTIRRRARISTTTESN